MKMEISESCISMTKEENDDDYKFITSDLSSANLIAKEDIKQERIDVQYDPPSVYIKELPEVKTEVLSDSNTEELPIDKIEALAKIKKYIDSLEANASSNPCPKPSYAGRLHYIQDSYRKKRRAPVKKCTLRKIKSTRGRPKESYMQFSTYCNEVDHTPYRVKIIAAIKELNDTNGSSFRDIYQHILGKTPSAIRKHNLSATYTRIGQMTKETLNIMLDEEEIISSAPLKGPTSKYSLVGRFKIFDKTSVSPHISIPKQKSLKQQGPIQELVTTHKEELFTTHKEELLFSNRRDWHDFPELHIQKPKSKKALLSL